MTLYRVCCIEYTWLLFRFPNVFFLGFKQFDSMKPIQLLKTYEKNVYKCIGFTFTLHYMKIINNKHTLLYNLPTIHSIQRYNGLCELTKCLIHTYIIGHYNPSVWITDLVSHTTYVVCVNFIHKWRDLQFKVDSEWQSFWETFHGNFIYSQNFCQKSAERKSPKKYFSYFILMSGLGLEPWLFV